VALDGEGQRVAGVGGAGLPEAFREHLRSPDWASRGRSTYEHALARQGVAVYADWRQRAGRVFGGACPLPSPWQTAAIAGLEHQGAAVGVLTALYREGEIPYAAETAFLAALADQAATAAANARLLVAAREKVVLEERQRLSRELHDSVSQSLYAIQMAAQLALEGIERAPAEAARPVNQIMQLADASQAEMRALIFELRPETLERDGLVAALGGQVDAFRSTHGISARLIAGAEPALPVEVKRAFQAIAREALCNAAKHARARHVEVRLEADQQVAVLEVGDDGVGFDAGGSFPGHLGLRSMHERAAGAGGSLEVVSAPGRGTRIVVRVGPGAATAA
jgi:signal transduction histidine kinase